MPSERVKHGASGPADTALPADTSLPLHSLIPFPSPHRALPEGLLCIGGELSPDMLLSAYRQGIFPWYSDDNQPIQWWSPDPRALLFPDSFRLSDRTRRSLRSAGFTLSSDRAFRAVIERCATIARPGQEGSWITRRMIEAYSRLHDLGWAHSFEVWRQEELCGGLYGISIGAAFFGESMFSVVRDASKAALTALHRFAAAHRFQFIDCQLPTPHLMRLGAQAVPRRRFLALLAAALQAETIGGTWQSA